MARGAAVRRGRAEAATPLRSRARLPDREEPVLASGQKAVRTEAAVIAMAMRAVRLEAADATAPLVVAVAAPSPTSVAPEILIAATASPETAAVTVPEVAPIARDHAGPADRPAKRITASLVASVLLHVGAVALFAWASLNAPVLPADGEDGIPVELVAASDQAASSQQEIASGKDEGQTPSVATEQRQAIEAPPAETPPEPAADEPTDMAADQPPVAQPDPVSVAERIISQLPTPPMPDTLPIMERAPEPPPVEAQPVTEPVREAPPPAPEAQPQPAQETPPQPAQDPTQRVETPEPSEVQAMVSPPAAEPPPPAPPQLATTPPQPVTPPVVRREQPREPVVRRQATRPPPARREAPTDASRTRPTRQTATTASPERPARAARQAESRAASAPRGEGTGRQNRQAASGNAASGGSNAAAVASYRQRAIAHVARFKVFPQAAQDRGQRGSVGFTFTVTRGGQVTSVAVTGSSGVPLLDQATLSMVRRAVPFPPIPEGGPASMTISTRIGYTLH